TLRPDRRGRGGAAPARAVVTAAARWLGGVAGGGLGLPRPLPVRLVKGSHIVVARLFAHDRAYILPVPDGRIIFARPFGDAFTLIGTTEEDFAGDPSAVNVAPH